jgi:hypothetical protein
MSELNPEATLKLMAEALAANDLDRLASLPPAEGRAISPMGWAVLNGSARAVQALVQDGRFTIRHALKFGETALDFAIRRQASPAVIAELLRSPELTPAELRALGAFVDEANWMERGYQTELRQLFAEVLHPSAVHPRVSVKEPSPA